jgi:Flp pilus assembly protein TadG
MVEFALVLPILLLLVLMLFDLGRTVQAHTTVAAAAREGARAGSIAATGADPAALVQTIAADAVQSAAIPLDIPTTSISVLQTSTNVTVSVVYRVAPVTPMVGLIVGGSITVVGTSSLPVQ